MLCPKEKFSQNVLTSPQKCPPSLKHSTHKHTLPYKKHLCPTLLTLSASFPERHIKGYVHSKALCSLNCSRAATDPQILTFKPSGGKSEQQERRREMGRKSDMHGQTDRGKCLQVGVVNLLWLNLCLPAVNVGRECVY